MNILLEGGLGGVLVPANRIITGEGWLDEINEPTPKEQAVLKDVSGFVINAIKGARVEAPKLVSQ